MRTAGSRQLAASSTGQNGAFADTPDRVATQRRAAKGHAVGGVHDLRVQLEYRQALPTVTRVTPYAVALLVFAIGAMATLALILDVVGGRRPSRVVVHDRSVTVTRRVVCLVWLVMLAGFALWGSSPTTRGIGVCGSAWQGFVTTPPTFDTSSQYGRAQAAKYEAAGRPITECDRAERSKLVTLGGMALLATLLAGGIVAIVSRAQSSAGGESGSTKNTVVT